jgi:16S rRNA C967 or C1407 C5-methylase (RsmB/RsmF family)/NOL1/NOP2/fmu family ribosome biogenesis protein
MELAPEFISQIKSLLPDEADALLGALSHDDATVSLRVNPARGALVPAALERVPWCDLGAYLDGRHQFTFDVDFQSGRYYVQDASSMFIHHVISSLVKTPVRYLDLCAAPGGKTTAALSSLPAGSLVVANEIVPQRARVLRGNIVKWGYSQCIVTSNSPADYSRLTHFFDVIAADVPCSGEGMFRKDDEAVAQWSPALVSQCAERQRMIVDEAWQALRPGGLFIYSTCTYNRSENEDIVEYLVNKYGAESVQVPVDASWKIHPAVNSICHCYRFMPHMTRGEGLFMSVLRKPDDELVRNVMKAKKQRSGKAKGYVLPRGVESWLNNAADFNITENEGNIVAVPTAIAVESAFLESSLNVIKSGVMLGTVKGKNCLPSHTLALSLDLNRDAFAQCEVDYAQAITFLRGEAMTVDAQRGYVLLTHRGIPLGFVNNLGNRANNILPKSMRILSQHVPDEEPIVLK